MIRKLSAERNILQGNGRQFALWGEANFKIPDGFHYPYFYGKETKNIRDKTAQPMSLDNIQLPPSAIQGLFSKSLVALNPGKSAAGAKSNISLLGKNGQGILVLVDHANAVHLPDEELELLLNILLACKRSMDDAAVINLHTQPQLTYQQLSNELEARIILFFGPGPDSIQLPLSFPHYQVQHYSGLTLLWSPALNIIRTNKTEKATLWKCLQQIFNA
jgi:hypothetical protein